MVGTRRVRLASREPFHDVLKNGNNPLEGLRIPRTPHVYGELNPTGTRRRQVSLQCKPGDLARSSKHANSVP